MQESATLKCQRASCFTFGDGGAVGIGDEAGETHVDGAAEASVHGNRRSKVGDTFPVVELPADGNHAAADILAALFTHKAGVDTWKKKMNYPPLEHLEQGSGNPRL